MNGYLISFIFIAGCAVNSITPSGSGLEMDIDISRVDFRHGWAYFSRPVKTTVKIRDVDSINRGRQLFTVHCQKCHGPTGKGLGPLAEALNLKPANLTNLPKNLNSSYILVQIKDGKGSMPMWRDVLTISQTKDLSNYIKELSRK